MKNVPQLRFKGFNDAWQSKKLGNISKSFSGGTPKVGVKEYYDGNIPFIRSAEINSNKTELFISQSGLKNSSAKLVHQGEILYALYGATSGEVGISKIAGAINQAILNIKPVNDINKYFLVTYLRKNKNKFINKYLQGGQGNLSAKIVNNYLLHFPSYEEQQKVGTFFNKLDDLITKQTQKIALLKQLKQGYLQKLFPQAGQTTPQLRFKGFNDEWEKDTLKSLCKKIKAGGTPISSNTEYYGEGYSFLSISDMSSNGKCINKVSKSITDKGLNNSSAWLLSKNNLLLSMYASIGKVAINKDNITFSQAIVGIIPKENISLEFLYQYMNYLQVINYYRPLISEGTQKNLNIKKVKNIIIMIPSETEQQRIGTLFAKLDNLIALQNRKLALLQELKKGYLQKMFI